MGRIQHYDVFAILYDLTNEPLHRRHRRGAVELLRLQPGAESDARLVGADVLGGVARTAAGTKAAA